MDVACRNGLLAWGNCNALTLEALGNSNAGRVSELRDRGWEEISEHSFLV